MKIKIISTILLSLLAAPSFANNPDGTGSAEGIAKITIDVPSFCTITNNSAFSLSAGEYLNRAISRSFTYRFNCNVGTNIKMFVSMGGNPQSTVSERRMPLDGVAGDVPHYMIYTLSHNNVPFGGPDNLITHFVRGYVDSDKQITLKLDIPAEQNNLVTGKYSERLEAIIEYF